MEETEPIVAYKVLNYIDKGSIVFIHDFYPGPEYHRYLNGMMRLLVSKDTQQGDETTIVGLKKK